MTSSKRIPINGITLFIFLTLFGISVNAATFTVTKTADTMDSTCDSDCSFREAVAAANYAGSNDIIEFDSVLFGSPQTITLTSELIFFNNGSLTISGSGSNLLTVTGNNQNRLFLNEGANLTISGLKITGGNGIGNNSGTGGAIFNGFAGTLTLNNSIVTNNIANRAGGIYNVDASTLIVNNSVISNNTSAFGGGGIYTTGPATVNNSSLTENNGGDRGGAILNDGATVSVNNSTINNNIVGSSGGGITNNGVLNLTNSTVSGNIAASGGGISSQQGQITTNIANSTISGNSVSGSGGGISIFNAATTVNLANSTVTGNKSDSDSNGSGNGGGINNQFGGIINAKNTIFAGNIDNTNLAPDFSGTLSSQGYNLIERTAGLTITGTTAGNILGQSALLLPLGNYGGATKTHGLQTNSPAIDKANPSDFPATDQRSLMRPRDGDLNGSVLPDIGAFERQIMPFFVTKTADTNDNICDSDCSLREAVKAANASASPTSESVILFSSEIFSNPQTITLTLGELQINSAGIFSFQGAGSNLLTISGNNASRILYITGGATVTVNGIKLTGGNGGASGTSGGAIYNNNGTLTLTNATLTANRSGFDGGAVYNGTGILNLVNSTISGNLAENNGGGVLNNTSGTVNVTNSFLSGNSALNGGGIQNFGGLLTVSGSIFSDNYANLGGGIYSLNAGTLSVSDSIFASNTAGESGGGINSVGNSTITSTIFDNNRANSGNGGGIKINADSVITASTIKNNTSGDGGGGIYNIGNLQIINSKISANHSNNRGGGIDSNGTLNVRTSLISYNTASQFGGGVNNNGSLIISNSTIGSNSASGQLGGGGVFNESTIINYLLNTTIADNTANVIGGGVRNKSGALILRNTIVGRNSSGSGNAPDFSGTITSQGYNLIQNINGAIINQTTTGNIIGQDPRLGSLALNDGFTETYALLADSPAIDGASPSQVEPYDQRGVSRPRDGNGDGISRADIGAFELRPLIVSNNNDNGSGSLRQALLNSINPSDAVVFTSGVFSSPQTISLTTGELVVPANARVNITGRGIDQLTISGNNSSRVFYISPGAKVSISGLTVTGGNGIGAINSGSGGGILNDNAELNLDKVRITANNTSNGNGAGIKNDNGGILKITDSTVSFNTASNRDGGGIFSFGSGSVINISNSTLNNNSANSGGGIYNFSTLNISNSTVSGNTAALSGGGIVNDGLFGGVVNSNYSTFSNNRATTEGGGINNISGSFNSRAGIFADNSTTSQSAPDFKGILSSQGYNLIENINSTVINGTLTGNITGQDPKLGSLANNGGATFTQKPLSSSPAIDAADPINYPFTDQRGVTRPKDGDGNGILISDIGAVEFNESATRKAPFDFDGDGKSDIGIFRPSGGEWWITGSASNVTFAAAFGSSSDKITPADFTGDGKTDLAFFRPSSGTWFILRSEDFSFYGFPFGASGDVPVSADFDGDGKADPAVFRASNSGWYIQKSSGGIESLTFGTTGDSPVVADYDGDGKADIAITRINNGTREWWIRRSSDGQVFSAAFGDGADKAVQGDYTGDGKADIAIWRPSNGFWYIIRSEDFSFYGFPFGASSDTPTPGDYDGDGKFDAAVFRQSNSGWYQMRSTQGFTALTFGTTGDVPIPSAFIP